MKPQFFLLISLLFAFIVNGYAQTASFTIRKWFSSPYAIEVTNTSSDIEEITDIDWDFGDGTHATDTALHRYTVFHGYGIPGKYTITLTVTYDSVVETYTDTFIFDTVELVTYSPWSTCIWFGLVTFNPYIPILIGSEFVPDSLIIRPMGNIYPVIDTGPFFNINTMVYIHNQVYSPKPFKYENFGKYLPYFRYVTHKRDNSTERYVIEWYGAYTIFVIDFQPDFISERVYGLNIPVIFENTTTVTPTLLADSIHWDYGNGDSLWIYNTDTESHNGRTTYGITGTYRITLTEYYKECSKSKSYDIEVRDDVGIANFNNANADIVVYPNPANGLLIIENGELKMEDYSIFSITGQMEMQGKLQCRDATCRISTINIASLAQGMYYLKIAGKTVKFVK